MLRIDFLDNYFFVFLIWSGIESISQFELVLITIIIVNINELVLQ